MFSTFREVSARFREVFKLHGQLNVKYLPYELENFSFLVASLNAAVVFKLRSHSKER